MLKKLKWSFILLAMVSMTVTLVAAFTVTNFALRHGMSSRADEIIQLLYENDGEFPMDFNPDDSPAGSLHEETPYATRYYIAYVDEGDVVVEADYSHVVNRNIQRIRDQVSEILKKGKDHGYLSGTYRYGVYYLEDAGEGYTRMVIVVDCTSDMETVGTLLTVTLVTIMVCVVVVFLLLLILSKRVLRPFEENREKQRRFITDAGHELKTPIAIIQSNAEVLEMMDGESKWISNIKTQTSRMSKLVKGLIELSKMDEQTRTEKERQRILLTEIATDTVESFRVPAEARGIKLTVDIAPSVYINGDLEDIIRLISILMDNAVKYTDERGELSVKLYTKSKRAFLIVSNTCAGLDKSSVSKFFDRFYRSDSSHNSKTGGYGIGLSMAQMIVQNHKGKLSAAYTNDERIVFTAEL